MLDVRIIFIPDGPEITAATLRGPGRLPTRRLGSGWRSKGTR